MKLKEVIETSKERVKETKETRNDKDTKEKGRKKPLRREGKRKPERNVGKTATQRPTTRTKTANCRSRSYTGTNDHKLLQCRLYRESIDRYHTIRII